MKTRTWILLLSAVLLAAIFGAVALTSGADASQARIISGGRIIDVVDLSRDCSFTVEQGEGVNVVTVSDGRICVSEANCPDHTCMNMGWRSSGGPIVCLPNSLIIEFVSHTGVDGAAG